MEPPTRVEVDGETVDAVASRDRPGQYHYTWVSGPNPGHGFSTGSSHRRVFSTHTCVFSDGRAVSSADIEASIRLFLSQVDPEIGYIE